MVWDILHYYRMIIYCLSYAHDIMIWITRSSDLHSDNIITTTTTTSSENTHDFMTERSQVLLENQCTASSSFKKLPSSSSYHSSLL